MTSALCKRRVYLGVAGDTAGYVDLEHSLGTHLPLVLALVVASTLVVLFLMTGSLVLGVKAVLMNALSLSAVFGILVLIFQHGNLQGLLVLPEHRRPRRDPADPALRDRLRARHRLRRLPDLADQGSARQRHPDNRAVAIGLERTGRIVTAAALLFSVAIGAFVTSKLVFIKELGLGIALAVLIDAFVIRGLLVPSLMHCSASGTGGPLAPSGDSTSAPRTPRLGLPWERQMSVVEAKTNPWPMAELNRHSIRPARRLTQQTQHARRHRSLAHAGPCGGDVTRATAAPSP